MSLLRERALTLVFLAFVCGETIMTIPVRAETELPGAVQTEAAIPLKEVGAGSFRKFGFRVYNATLWAPNGIWDAHQPYALQLEYTRDVSKDTLVETVASDMSDQGVADAPTLSHWRKILNDALPDVNAGDVMVGVSVPGKNAMLFVNGRKVASIDDQAFSQAFFNVWLGEHADEDLRAKLLNQKE